MHFIDFERNTDVVSYLKTTNPEFNRTNKIVRYLYIILMFSPTPRVVNTKYQVISVNRWKYWPSMNQGGLILDGLERKVGGKNRLIFENSSFDVNLPKFIYVSLSIRYPHAKLEKNSKTSIMTNYQQD